MASSLSKFGRQTIQIPCKVNLHLGIHTQKDQRGYHKVDSLMVPVALYDTVVVDDAPELTVTHEPQLCVLPERTTTWKAAVLLANKLGVSPDVSIDVQVHIPEKAGLGGSSAEFDVSPVEPVSFSKLSALLQSEKKTIQQVAELLFNNLAPAAKALKPQVAEVEQWLKAQPGVLGAQVSGSGSSSFALCNSQGVADAIAAAAQIKGWRGFSTTCKL